MITICSDLYHIIMYYKFINIHICFIAFILFYCCIPFFLDQCGNTLIIIAVEFNQYSVQKVALVHLHLVSNFRGSRE